MTPDEFPGPRCWCGQRGCIETFLSGPALAADCDGPGARDASAPAGPRRGRRGAARGARWIATRTGWRARWRLWSTWSTPTSIVLGGGLSNMAHLYETVPRLMPRHVFSDACDTPVLRAVHGDSSGVLGAARLWDGKEPACGRGWTRRDRRRLRSTSP